MFEEKIKSFKKWYYINILVRGVILASSILLTYFLAAVLAEYYGRLSPAPRAVILFSFIGVSLFSFYWWILKPLLAIWNIGKVMTDQEAARYIGKHFPEVQDRLLNVLQLKYSQYGSEALRQASIQQESIAMAPVKFDEAISIKDNAKHLKYLGPVLAVLVYMLIVSPRIVTEPVPRLIQYNETFNTAPFDFLLQNKTLEAFKNESFVLEVELEGESLPTSVEVAFNTGEKVMMTKTTGQKYAYELKNIRRSLSFNFVAAGFSSQSFQIKAISRPVLRTFNVRLDYPPYTNKKSETLNNIGNISAPKGTKVQWIVNTQEAKDTHLYFSKSKSELKPSTKNDQQFVFDHQAMVSEPYQLWLENEHSVNKDTIEFFLNVLPDAYPIITAKPIQDTTLYSFIATAGSISDDYGLTRLKFQYKVLDKKGNAKSNTYSSMSIPFNRQLASQSFFYKIDIDSFHLQKGESLEYFFTVWDNDQVSGAKSSKTSLFRFNLPNEEAIEEKLSKESGATESQLSETLKQANEFKKELEKLQDRIKGKKQLTYQDKKALEKMLEEKKKLEEAVRKLQEQNKSFNEAQEKFGNKNEEIAKKAEQLQKLMEDILDDETKQLYEELNKLMDESSNTNQLQEMLEQLKMKEDNVEKELDRAIELFKKLKFEQKVEDVATKLEDLAEQQEALSEETKDASKNELEELAEQQEALNEEFEKIQEEDLKELEQLNDDLKNSNDLDQQEERQEAIEQQQQEAKEQLNQKNKKKAEQSQKKSASEMRQMASEMKNMMSSMEMQQMTENYNDLRQILDNLVKLSFDQEEIMVETRKIHRVDPKFVEISQKQLKLQDDARVIEDSLTALSQRVFQIQSFVTRELGEMNYYMGETMEAVRARRPEIASVKQQFTMTSINNLALLLDDILKQMQNAMSQSMPGAQMNQKQQSGNTPSLSDFQKQLNQQIQQMKKSGMSGKQMSKELAKMAAQQEMIRNSMQKQMGSNGQQGGQGGKDGSKGKEEGKEGEEGQKGGDEGKYKELLEKMEQTELDLLNRQITQETLERQQDILTRLLESEKASRERELEKKREAETAKEQKEALSPDFSEYLKLKEAQIEMLKTIPPDLNPYYKNEVNEYFKKIKESNQ